MIPMSATQKPYDQWLLIADDWWEKIGRAHV